MGSMLPATSPIVRDRRVVDLFAGAGGLTLGLKAAGFRAVSAVEMSAMAAETYYRNFISRDPVSWQDHLARGAGDQLRAGLGVCSTHDALSHADTLRQLIGEDSLDLLAGGPPCQGFSLAGLRKPEDQRNKLPFEFLEFVRLLNPKAVLIENVAGIGSFRLPTGGNALQELRDALQVMGKHGYVAQILQLNAKHFGVPQSRPRVMIVALRRDLLSGWRRRASQRICSWPWQRRVGVPKSTERPLLAPRASSQLSPPPCVKQSATSRVRPMSVRGRCTAGILSRKR